MSSFSQGSNITLLTWVVVMFFCHTCFGQAKHKIDIRGIYGHPAPLWDRGYVLSDLGVNAIFVHSGSIDQNLIERAHVENQKVFAEFATLNGKAYVKQHPEAHPIDRFGKRVDAASWFMGVCPTNIEFRKYRMKQLRDLLSEFDLDGIWMDYVHWHAQFEEPEPILPETCFCEDCLMHFTEDTGLEISGTNIEQKSNWILENADSAWRSWRCAIIVDWIKEIKEILNQEKPEALLGLYHCPWKDEEFGQARRRILGLDYDLLIDFVDVFSPMVYHGRMHRNPEWVRHNILWHSERLQVKDNGKPQLWPIVQAHDDPEIISVKEFEKVLRGGSVGRASGVMMFTTRALAENPKKIEVMQQFYTELAK